ncbi:MAG: hypothetical protein KAI79_17265 [Bacteroidales bacterium]|nr:hypothetical protein [Bacteroidales bacterium]
MNKQTNSSICHRLAITASISVLLGFGTIATAQENHITQTANEAPFMIAAVTQGAENRQDRRGDRQDDRGDRKDTRQDCRQEEGVGKDKRDCKQDGRQDRKND